MLRPSRRRRRLPSAGSSTSTWAVLLEQLMEVPEEGPVERKGGKER
jgi:hypothetical protein